MAPGKIARKNEELRLPGNHHCVKNKEGAKPRVSYMSGVVWSPLKTPRSRPRDTPKNSSLSRKHYLSVWRGMNRSFLPASETVTGRGSPGLNVEDNVCKSPRGKKWQRMLIPPAREQLHAEEQKLPRPVNIYNRASFEISTYDFPECVIAWVLT